jgi:hypothetical protein
MVKSLINGVFNGNIIYKWTFDWDVHESRGSQDIASSPGREVKAVESQAGRELWGETRGSPSKRGAI